MVCIHNACPSLINESSARSELCSSSEPFMVIMEIFVTDIKEFHIPLRLCFFFIIITIEMSQFPMVFFYALNYRDKTQQNFVKLLSNKQIKDTQQTGTLMKMLCYLKKLQVNNSKIKHFLYIHFIREIVQRHILIILAEYSMTSSNKRLNPIVSSRNFFIYYQDISIDNCHLSLVIQFAGRYFSSIFLRL